MVICLSTVIADVFHINPVWSTQALTTLPLNMFKVHWIDIMMSFFFLCVCVDIKLCDILQQEETPSLLILSQWDTSATGREVCGDFVKMDNGTLFPM